MNFKKTAILAAIAVLVITMACGGSKKTETSVMSNNQDSITACNADSLMAQLSPNIPHEVDAVLGLAYNSILPGVQPCFDIFSWQTFVALNWPADAAGNPLPNFTDSAQAQRVWEYYQAPSQVFQTNEFLLPFKGPYKMQPGLKGLHQFATLSSEMAITLPDSIKQATGQPLIDKNLNFVLYEIKMNPDEVNYINTYSLNTTEGQQAFKNDSNSIFFPTGTYTAGIGAMEIKSTWKILVSGKDNFSSYYTRPAVIYVPASQSANKQPLYLKETVGLVAMHIIHKTNRFQTWVWSSFEHINNAPEKAGVDTATNIYAFYNPVCKTCKTNAKPPKANPYVWQIQKPYAANYANIVNSDSFGTQVVRTNPVYVPTDNINKKMQKKLNNLKSVFANYRLIGSQWAISQDSPPFGLILAPDTLANTTLETYVQNSSCTMTCHKFATDAVGAPSDFSFLLAHARSTAYLKAINKKK
jgi:hypothetical protein